MEDIKVQVFYKNKIYTFKHGSEAYIFHTGLYKEVDKKYSMKQLLQYVAFVNQCYMLDSNRTPLGDLADFIADNWKKFKTMSHYYILDKFYMEYFI